MASAAQLADVVSEARLDIARLMEATFHQGPYSRLAGRALKGGNTGVPFCCEFCIWWQGRDIYEAFGFHDGLLVERGNPGRQRVDKSVELCVRQCAIDIAIKLSEVA